ncbi:MAG TPA: hypothetical protein VFQ61_34355, partial [Polyangiaceae bacterium]|nr:hypothetical protein [Polyangiaceae bacterium]
MRPVNWFFVLLITYGSPAMAQSRGATSAPRAPAQASDAGLNDETELTRVVSLFEAGKYRQCAEELKGLLSDEGTRRLRDRD